VSPAPTLAPTDMSVASAHLREARRVRGDAVQGLASGVLSLGDLLELAELPEWVALRQIPVGVVLRALGSSEARTRHQLEEIRRLSGASSSPNRLTVGWVVDRRATGRVEALADVALSTNGRVAPAPRWPFSTVPSGGQQ